jgi:hypothetical protein
MRKGYNNEFLDFGLELLGLNFGADYCAEHEWGIKEIRRKFGITDSGIGLSKRKITILPKDLEWVKTKKFEGFWVKTWCDAKIEDYNISPGKELYTAWCGSDFGAFSSNPKEIVKLREIFEAIQKLDATIWLGGGGAFQNAGFVICIASRLPKEVVDNWEAKDKEEEQLQKDFDATGIEEKLKKAGKGYFALAPKRKKDGSLKFWLNPEKQNIYRAGWVTLEDLELWIQDKGPILIP